MMKFAALCVLAAVTGASASEEFSLTPDNWDAKTSGKTVFIKFQAPWWGHCKRMKPAWDKLCKQFGDSTTAGVFDVDCTAAGKPLCDSNGVRGFPTIKWGSPDNLEKYEGGRDYDSLKEFAENNLKPVCSPANIDLCDDDKKKEIETFQAMSSDELKAAITEKEGEQEAAEKNFKSSVEKLQKKYESLQKDKDDAIAAVKASGLGLMKAVKATRA